MKYYEAIKNLSLENMEKFLDQVFLTGFNSGYQSLVDAEIDGENPFDSAWLEDDVDSPTIVEDEKGESLMIRPLASVIIRIVEYKSDSTTKEVTWRSTVVLPKGIGDDDECQETEKKASTDSVE